MKKIRVGIVGYGNLGKSAEYSIRQFPDLEGAGIFTRRDPRTIKAPTGMPVYAYNQAPNMTDDIDVMLLCSGSRTDLPEQGPEMARLFNTVDGYDTHAKIPAYRKSMDEAARSGSKTAIIAVGWDPGLFSLQRLLGDAILPEGSQETFWGKGVSQGHSDAIRRIAGVKDARQYTIPKREAVEAVKRGDSPKFKTYDKHLRECYVVCEPDADPEKIEMAIKTMPHYFADYETIVHFVTEEELARDHQGLPHSGMVFRYGKTGANSENTHLMTFSLKLDANPDFTAQVLLSCARAVWRLNQDQAYGAKTIFDIPPIYLSHRTPEDAVKNLL